ncbi:paraquat-inducible protein A [Agaribacter flavus]|uniref:Paraquat-inducible protein A n=1 Tax=Agaribacter flavus TaxID=1902781 RepID=A0ABV7FRX8_9ALTE
MKQETHTCYAKGSAAESGLINCRICHHLTACTEDHCQYCNAQITPRVKNSVQITLSLLVTSFLLYIPANLYPIMTTTLLGDAEPSTIIGGVVLFLSHGSYFIAAVIFVASIIVPLAKMFALAWLCYAATCRHEIDRYELTRLYRITEFIGKWSMVDVFVVAILVALIQLSGLMSIQVGIAASAFAGVVLLTMLSALKFDTRILWDKAIHK